MDRVRASRQADLMANREFIVNANGIYFGKPPGKFEAADRHQVVLCRVWLRAHARPSLGPEDRSSYGYKHDVENWIRSAYNSADCYISNGAFVAAAIAEGYDPVDVQPPNCRFNMRVRVETPSGRLRTRALNALQSVDNQVSLHDVCACQLLRCKNVGRGVLKAVLLELAPCDGSPCRRPPLVPRT